ncbi:MAG: BCD family MFS transporter [Pseudomonadota bacterium]
MSRTVGWWGVVRLGLVQTSLGAIVVLTTSTLNRVMVVELALPAMLPGFLVAIHYFVQISRPRFGHGSDAGRRRTPWIIAGMALLGLGGVVAAAATGWMASAPVAGTALAVVAFLMIGTGVGASGTCLLVLLAASVPAERRAAAASITWIMMIMGFAVTAGVVGAFLDPFSYTRLIVISAIVSLTALSVTVLALRGLEGEAAEIDGGQSAPGPGFKAALTEVLAERHTRRFALFVFVSMLAYSAQDLVLEPFAGAIFALTPGQSTQLGGLQHAGVLLGMLFVAVVGTRLGLSRERFMRAFVVTGCLASTGLLTGLAIAGFSGGNWPLYTNVFLLGIANGVFAVAAIGAMMGLVSQGAARRDGVRMGIWGAAQAIAFGLGGALGTAAVDLVRWLSGSALYAYSIVFLAQGLLFAIAVVLALRLSSRPEAGFRNLPQQAAS